jgi:hypothetical protein
MHDDVQPVSGEPSTDRRPDAAAAAGHQRSLHLKTVKNKKNFTGLTGFNKIHTIKPGTIHGFHFSFHKSSSP